MRTPLAWLNLVHEKTRLLVAIAGVAFAVMIIFMNLGFLGALGTAASAIYTKLNADIVLSSPKTLEIGSSKPFPIDRLYQAAGIEGVERVMPLYLGISLWRNAETRKMRAIFIYAFNPNDPVFLLPELATPELQAALRRPNTVLIDQRSRPEYGPRDIGIETELNRRAATIGGHYELGGGFSADGTLIMSDQNFRRYFDPRPLNLIDFGLIQLTPGTDTDAVAAKLRQVLPADVRVFTRQEIMDRDRTFWIQTTSTGFIFGMGVVVALIVGTVIVYQILYTDITQHRVQYATLKAMGYPSTFLFSLVLQEALILACLGYIPGFAISLGLYDMAYKATAGTLLIMMDAQRAILVFCLTLGMCTVSGLISVRKAVVADPAEVY
ncbi:ABC transporter permease DevC [Trichothermofontia sichuanensis B231]|uniref:ABC transporter permease DevC n=1 Tax=Trichothermofontia sichuanensis TaxID=3045816 RepID=UPI0022466C92|nr:ABC transporter permease DevC [Trichothermofontia sichuanensis]UZQ53660.1 ABC transporter permease DevC [Trichothermofontia sichuanensis B231]